VAGLILIYQTERVPGTFPGEPAQEVHQAVLLHDLTQTPIRNQQGTVLAPTPSSGLPAQLKDPRLLTAAELDALDSGAAGFELVTITPRRTVTERDPHTGWPTAWSTETAAQVIARWQTEYPARKADFVADWSARLRRFAVRVTIQEA